MPLQSLILTHTHLCCTTKPRGIWLIMQGNAARHMFAWRQLTDLICWAPVTCWRTFSSSFSMRPAQWIILQKINKTHVPQHLHLNRFSHSSLSLHMNKWLSTSVCPQCVLLESCHNLCQCFRIPIWTNPFPNVQLSHQHFLCSSNPACIYLVGPGRTGGDWACLASALDLQLHNKIAGVWQKCTLGRSWSPLDGAKLGIKRSNAWSSLLYISHRATNDLMDPDLNHIKEKEPAWQPGCVLLSSQNSLKAFSNQMNKLCHAFTVQPPAANLFKITNQSHQHLNTMWSLVC